MELHDILRGHGYATLPISKSKEQETKRNETKGQLTQRNVSCSLSKKRKEGTGSQTPGKLLKLMGDIRVVPY